MNNIAAAYVISQIRDSEPFAEASRIIVAGLAAEMMDIADVSDSAEEAIAETRSRGGYSAMIERRIAALAPQYHARTPESSELLPYSIASVLGMFVSDIRTAAVTASCEQRRAEARQMGLTAL